MRKREWYDDITKGKPCPFIAETRLNMLSGWGLTHDVLSFFCKQIFEYKEYVTDIILSKDERDLFATRNESWFLMRRIMESDDMSARRRGRNCYATAKDILVDGMFTDIILHHLHYFFPDFNIKKNKQDEVLELKQKASIEPDFLINDKIRLEMKISGDTTDELNRSAWSNTLTIRSERLQSELLRYKDYQPLYFLRINYTSNRLAIINYKAFKESKSGDGSKFAPYNPKNYSPANFKSFITLIRDEIRNQIHA